MQYDFDQVIERRQTDCLKWDAAEKRVGAKDVLPLWVADMDFQVAAPINAALQQRVAHGIFGYPIISDACYDAVIGWMQRRHQWPVAKEWITFVPGVVPALHWAVMAYTQPGDKVIVQPPVYYPFFKAARANGCEVVENPLIYENGRYVMNFAELEQLFDARTKLFLLCSPHNPVGRVWTRAELTRLGELCRKHNVLICSDEIHADLVFPGATHIPLAAVSDDIAQITITCNAPNKTFNIAGLSAGFVIIPNPQRFAEFGNVQQKIGEVSVNLLGLLAMEVAYTEGEEWFRQLMAYLQGNLAFLTDFIGRHLPQIKVIRPESNFLVWLDCRELELNDAELKDFLLQQAHVWLSAGTDFGSKEPGFQRLNFACPRATLAEALNRIAQAVKNVVTT